MSRSHDKKNIYPDTFYRWHVFFMYVKNQILFMTRIISPRYLTTINLMPRIFQSTCVRHQMEAILFWVVEN